MRDMALITRALLRCAQSTVHDKQAPCALYYIIIMIHDTGQHVWQPRTLAVLVMEAGS